MIVFPLVAIKKAHKITQHTITEENTKVWYIIRISSWGKKHKILPLQVSPL